MLKADVCVVDFPYLVMACISRTEGDIHPDCDKESLALNFLKLLEKKNVSSLYLWAAFIFRHLSKFGAFMSTLLHRQALSSLNM